MSAGELFGFCFRGTATGRVPGRACLLSQYKYEHASWQVNVKNSAVQTELRDSQNSLIK